MPEAKVEILEHAEVRNIPISRLKWLKRPTERRKMPASYFLIPDERKFPVRNKDGSYNCNLIRAAIVRAAQYGYTEVQKKAQRLYARYCAKKSAEDLAKMSELDLAVVVTEKYTVSLQDYETKENKFKHLLIPYDKFYDPRYGELEFTEEMAKQIVENFNNGYPSYDPPLNIEHTKENGRVGVIVDLEMREDGLYAEFELTEDAKELLEKKRFGYLSPEIVLDYVDKVKSSEDNVVSVGAVLVGAALTNTPAQPLMVSFDFAKEVMEKYWMSEEKALKQNDEGCKPCEEAEKKAEEKKPEPTEIKEAEEQESINLAEEIRKLKEEKEVLEMQLKEAQEENRKLNEKLKRILLDSWKNEWRAKGLKQENVEKVFEMLAGKNYTEMVEMYSEIVKPLLEEMAKYVQPKVPLGQVVFADGEYDPETIGRKLAEEFNKKHNLEE